MKSVYIDYTKPLLRGGNSETKKDLDEKIKELKAEGWTVEFGKHNGINEGGFRWWWEATKFEEIKENECPRCKSENIVEIIYGYPTKKIMERAKKGEIELGGCEITEADPNRHCKDCLNVFFERSKA